MGIFTAQVILKATSGLPRDNAVNVYHFTGTGGDFDEFAQNMVQAYEPLTTASPGIIGGVTSIDCKVYDGQAAPPNPPLGMYAGPAIGTQTPGPREVALCLSARGAPALSARPPGLLKTERGRTFIGPLSTQYTASERPSTFLQMKILEVGEKIKAITISQPGFLWSAGSDLVQVSQIYVDNEWDTQRRRGLRPTGRLTRAV